MKDLLIVATYDNGYQFSVLFGSEIYYPKDDLNPKEELKTIWDMYCSMYEKEYCQWLKTRYSTAFKKIIFIDNGVIEEIK